MNVLKEKWNLISLALYGVSVICLFLPAYSVGAYGFSVGISAFDLLFNASFTAIVLFLVPIGGLVFALMTKGKKNYLIHMILFIVGIVIIFLTKMLAAGDYSALVGLGFGSILTILCYVAGVVIAFLNLGNK